MIFPTNIMIVIFSYCESSSLYSLLLTSKYIHELSKDTIKSPNVLVSLEFTIDENTKLMTDSLDVEYREFRFIPRKKYKNYKINNLTTFLGYDKNHKEIFEKIIMTKIEDVKIINFMSYL